MARVAFLGTPPAAVPTLRRLVDAGVDVAAVVTRPDRRRSRSAPPEPSAVKAAALDLGLPVLEPADRGELAAALPPVGPLDVGIVVAFGMLLPAAVLAAPRRGLVNVHFSLLPRWRGAAPVARSLLAGDDGGGVSLMVLDEGLDTGPVLAVAATRYGPEETAGDIEERLARTGAELLVDVLPGYLAGHVSAVPQDPAEATSAPRLEAADGRLDPGDDPAAFVRRVRATTPRPGAYLVVGGERLKVLTARVGEGVAAPGELVPTGDRLLCGVAGGVVELAVVQAPSRRAVTGAEWARGRRGAPAFVDPVPGSRP